MQLDPPILSCVCGFSWWSSVALLMLLPIILTFLLILFLNYISRSWKDRKRSNLARAAQRNVKLKLFPDAPFLKLTILGDYLWVQHYHTDLDVEMMPKYVFKHDQHPGSLYVPMYQYFLIRWENPDIPEYDMDTDDLIYRDMRGKEVRRERFGELNLAATSQMEPPDDLEGRDNTKRREVSLHT